MSFKVLVLGGGLQGMEALYLGEKAGFEMDLLDKKDLPPALGLARKFRKIDIREDGLAHLEKVFGAYDLIIPALENPTVLNLLGSLLKRGLDVPIALDSKAYFFSRSKMGCKESFIELGLPVAKNYQKGLSRAPYIFKPNDKSGSKGVLLVETEEMAEQILAENSSPDPGLMEEYCAGPSYSVEITAINGEGQTWQVTKLEMADDYDCKRVLAPSDLSPGEIAEISDMAKVIARHICLTGIMDLEVIKGPGGFIILEIDARFPSQTPIAIFWSTGVNLVRAMAACFTKLPGREEIMPIGNHKMIRLEHQLSRDGEISVNGEHVMSWLGPVSLVKNFRGAREALVAGDPNGRFWVATMIFEDK